MTRLVSLEALLPEDHQARAVWAYVEKLSLEKSPLYERIGAVEGGPGRPPIDPRILLGLWVYATLDGVGSARELDRLCTAHVAYQWICGGVSVNYHTLADFRVENVDVLDRLLTHSVAALRSAGLVELNRVAQDGIRVRASAGSGSFRRKERLDGFLEEAKRQVDALRRELEADPAAPRRRSEAARERAAADRLRRIEAAIGALPKLEKRERRRKPTKEDDDSKPPAPGGGASGSKTKEPRASTTDADARVMKMADGGFRPAYNIQLCADTKSQATGVADPSSSVA